MCIYTCVYVYKQSHRKITNLIYTQKKKKSEKV